MTDRPYLADEREELATVAAELHADRAAAYPLAVGKSLTREQADAGIRVMGAIAADWRRIVDLYADRPAGSRDDTATRQEKIATLAQALQRATARLSIVRAALRKALPERWVNGIEHGTLNRNDLERAWLAGEIKAADVGVFLERERRLWAIEALLWHARRPLGPMFYAELNAELRARDRGKQVAAA